MSHELTLHFAQITALIAEKDARISLLESHVTSLTEHRDKLKRENQVLLHRATLHQTKQERLSAEIKALRDGNERLRRIGALSSAAEQSVNPHSIVPLTGSRNQKPPSTPHPTASTQKTASATDQFQCETPFCSRVFNTKSQFDAHTYDYHRGISLVFLHQTNRVYLERSPEDGELHCLCGSYSCKAASLMRNHSKLCHGAPPSVPEKHQKPPRQTSPESGTSSTASTGDDANRIKPFPTSLSSCLPYLEPNQTPNRLEYVPWKALFKHATSKSGLPHPPVSWVVQWCALHAIGKTKFTKWPTKPIWAIPRALYEEFVMAAIDEARRIQLEPPTQLHSISSLIERDSTNAEKRNRESSINNHVSQTPSIPSTCPNNDADPTESSAKRRKTAIESTVKAILETPDVAATVADINLPVIQTHQDPTAEYETTVNSPESDFSELDEQDNTEEVQLIPVLQLFNEMIPNYTSIVPLPTQDAIQNGVKQFLLEAMDNEIESCVSVDETGRTTYFMPEDLVANFLDLLYPELPSALAGIPFKKLTKYQ
ncbi:hypothetical protein HDU79_005222 [Rhizoclosmatium sp. JEL0117]|nr:hypothetical protein HDU79_005222 [Rhizoclosmatium sp. JEL0117]